MPFASRSASGSTDGRDRSGRFCDLPERGVSPLDIREPRRTAAVRFANTQERDTRMSQQAAGLVCPACRVSLVMSERSGVEIDYCPQCRGVWLDRGELDKILDRATS